LAGALTVGDADVLRLRSGEALHYGKSGSGPPLILLHGSPGSGRAWARVIKHLPADLRILTPDLPGYGESDPLAQNTPQRTAAIGAAIAELIDDCAEPVWLCGHSYGGNVALHAALRYRERIRGLALVEPVFVRALDLAGQSAARSDAEAFFTSYLVRAELGEPDAIGLMIDFWTGRGAYASLSAKQKYFLNEATAKNAQDVRASFAETLAADELRLLDRPVSISFGDASPPLAGLIAGALAALLPRAEVSVIPQATHSLLDTHPADVAGFIARHCRSRVAVG
jgi:pimeloyl-ACP methyl ester carboxylesterase